MFFGVDGGLGVPMLYACVRSAGVLEPSHGPNFKSEVESWQANLRGGEDDPLVFSNPSNLAAIFWNQFEQFNSLY